MLLLSLLQFTAKIFDIIAKFWFIEPLSAAFKYRLYLFPCDPDLSVGKGDQVNVYESSFHKSAKLIKEHIDFI